MIAPDPSLVTPEQAARILGCCKRLLLSEYIRRGILPYPTDGVWPRSLIEELAAKFDASRRDANARELARRAQSG